MYDPFPRGIYNSVWSWGATSAAWWGPCEPVCQSGRMPRLEGELRRRGYGTRGTIAREPWYPRGNCAAKGHVTSPHATFLSDMDGGAGGSGRGRWTGLRSRTWKSGDNAAGAERGASPMASVHQDPGKQRLPRCHAEGKVWPPPIPPES